MKKSKIITGLSLILLLSLSLSATVTADVDGETDGDTTSIVTDSLVVEIKGGNNVPFFFFWKTGDESIKYKLQMNSMFEVIDNTTTADGKYISDEDRKVPGALVSLSSLTWEFSEIDETLVGDAVTNIDFNLTSSDGMIQFNMHVDAENDAQLKFDVIINSYTFSDENAMLVIAFMLSIEGTGDETDQDGSMVSFGDGYFQSETTAEDDNGAINVGVSSNSEEEDGSMIYLSYEHFSGKMVHDPIIGVGDYVADGDSVQSDQESGIELPGLSRGLLVGITILSSLIAIAIPTIIYSRRKN